MRLGLIGATGHWQTYAAALGRVPGLELVAVAAAGPEETTGAFDHAPGQTVDTRRYDDARRMLEVERLDVVQVCARCDRIPTWARECLERGLPVMAEKPLAMDLATLEALFRAARGSGAALVPMHTMRSVPELAAVRRAVDAGEIGEPLLSFSQKTYKWGKSRPDSYRSRTTFPGLWRRGSASTPSTGSTGSSATSSRRSWAARGRRHTRTSRPAAAKLPLC